jgi:hypothetical protein
MTQTLVLSCCPYEDISPIATVAAVRASFRDVFFAPKTNAALSSVSGPGDNDDLIYKTHFAPP